MIVDLHNAQRDKALEAVRACRDAVVENEAAMWINALHAKLNGATLAQIAAATDTFTETARRRLRDVRGGG